MQGVCETAQLQPSMPEARFANTQRNLREAAAETARQVLRRISVAIVTVMNVRDAAALGQHCNLCSNNGCRRHTHSCYVWREARIAVQAGQQGGEIKASDGGIGGGGSSVAAATAAATASDDAGAGGGGKLQCLS